MRGWNYILNTAGLKSDTRKRSRLSWLENQWGLPEGFKNPRLCSWKHTHSLAYSQLQHKHSRLKTGDLAVPPAPLKHATRLACLRWAPNALGLPLSQRLPLLTGSTLQGTNQNESSPCFWSGQKRPLPVHALVHTLGRLRLAPGQREPLLLSLYTLRRERNWL